MREFDTIKPDAGRILESMSTVGQDLPSEWDEGGFCMEAAIDLAEYLARVGWRIPVRDRDHLVMIGAILIRSVYHQVEAGHEADRLMDRIRGERGTL